MLESARFIGGEQVAQFEREFAAFCEVKHAVTCASGTDGLYLSLQALKIGEGDEVISPAYTFVATVGSIRMARARPVLVDVHPDTLNLDPQMLQEKITPDTKAIMVVHLYGQPAEMARILQIAQKHNLHVIEDACQAHGARFNGKRAGSFGTAAAFSFYPTKNLGAYGDGGCVTTDSGELAETIRSIADHGRTTWTLHELEGVNSRLDALQAAILRVKLRYLEEWTQKRRRLAASYTGQLSDVPEIKPLAVARGAEHVYHLFVVRVQNREKLMEKLKARGIGCSVYYATPVHLQPAYSFLRCPEGGFPVSEKAAREVLALPLHPQMDEEQVDEVVSALKESIAS